MFHGWRLDRSVARSAVVTSCQGAVRCLPPQRMLCAPFRIGGIIVPRIGRIQSLYRLRKLHACSRTWIQGSGVPLGPKKRCLQDCVIRIVRPSERIVVHSRVHMMVGLEVRGKSDGGQHRDAPCPSGPQTRRVEAFTFSAGRHRSLGDGLSWVFRRWYLRISRSWSVHPQARLLKRFRHRIMTWSVSAMRPESGPSTRGRWSTGGGGGGVLHPAAKMLASLARKELPEGLSGALGV